MNGAAVGKDNVWPPDSLELVDYFRDRDARAKCQRDEAADGFSLRVEKAAGFA